MARRKTLTDAMILKQKPEAKRLTMPDPELRGHYVRITPKGAKSFVAVAREPVPITQIIRQIIDPKKPEEGAEKPAAGNSAANGKDADTPASAPVLVHSSPTHEG